MEYKNKTILLTGASSGIGEAIALALGPHRNRIFITARREHLLREVAGAIRNLGSQCEFHAADATVAPQAEQIVERVKRIFGGIDIA